MTTARLSTKKRQRISQISAFTLTGRIKRLLFNILRFNTQLRSNAKTSVWVNTAHLLLSRIKQKTMNKEFGMVAPYILPRGLKDTKTLANVGCNSEAGLFSDG